MIVRIRTICHVRADGDGRGGGGLQETCEAFGGIAFEGAGVEDAEGGVAECLRRGVEGRGFEGGVALVEFVESEELTHAEGADAAGLCVELDANRASTEKHGGEVIGAVGSFDTRDGGQRSGRVINEAPSERRRALGERAFETRGIEIALSEDERARAVRRDDEIFELARIDAAVTCRESL